MTKWISCSEDGSVVITGLQPGAGGEQTPPEVYNYGAKWPMLAVKLDPHYARRYLGGKGGGWGGYGRRAVERMEKLTVLV